MALAVIFTCRVSARHFLRVCVRMWTISCWVPAIPGRISLSSPLFSSAHNGNACRIIVHPPFLLSFSWGTRGARSHHPDLNMSWDSCCGRPSRQCFSFCIKSKFRNWGSMRSPRWGIWFCAGAIRRVTSNPFRACGLLLHTRRTASVFSYRVMRTQWNLAAGPG